MDLLLDGSSVNDKVLGETSCGSLKQRSSEGFYDTSEVCSLVQSETTEDTGVSYFTKRSCLSNGLGPVISNMHEQARDLGEHTSCFSLTVSNSTENERGTLVLEQALQHICRRRSREHAPSCKNVYTGKCMDSQTKSCTDNNAPPHSHLNIPSHHLKFDTISTEPSPSYLSTSDNKQDGLVHNLLKENPPTLNFKEHFQTPMEISQAWLKSEEYKLPSEKKEPSNNKSNAEHAPREPDVLPNAGQSSCKLVCKKNNEEAHMLDHTPTCSQSHSSCELSSDTNSISLINKTDKEMENGQIGAVSDDTTAHYSSLGQSESMTVSPNPETGVNCVFILENTSKDRMSEVNIGSPQPPTTKFLEKETAQVESYKDHSTHFAEHGRTSSCVNLSSVSTPVAKRKRVGCAFKKRKVLKMANVFSTIQELSENLTARSRTFSKDSNEIKTKTEKMQSATSRRKSCCTVITVRKQKNNSPSKHAEIKADRRFRKRRKVTHPALVTDCGPNWCVKSSKMSRPNTGQVFKVSSCPQRSSTTNRLLDCSEDPLKTEMHNEKHDSMSQSSAKGFHSNTSNTLMQMPFGSQKKDANEELWNERNSPELNSDAASISFHSCIASALDRNVQGKRSRNPLLGIGVKASDTHQELEQDADVKNSLCELNAVSLKSSVQKVDEFTQYCDEDMTTLHKDTRTVADAVKRTKRAKKYVNCKYCPQVFRHISAYTIHQRIHTGQKPYRCEVCGKNFARLSNLKSHRNVHVQSVSLPCPCCRKKFSGKRDLIAHFMTHVKGLERNNEPGQQDSIPDAPLRDTAHSNSGICNINNNKFPNRYVQKSHKHNEDKLISCKTCGKEFQTSSQLVVHEKTHRPVKPYACFICAKRFNQIKALKKHSQTHAGTPFSCSHCGCAFCDLPALRMHQISKLCNQKERLNGVNCDNEGFLVTHGVSGQVNTPLFFKCKICKQLYQKWCQYTLHLQTHTKSPPYLCFTCGQSYEKDSEVTDHCIVCCQTSGEEVACGSSLSEILHPRRDTYLKHSLPTDLFSIKASQSNSRSNAGQFHNNLSNLQTEHPMSKSSQFVKASHLPLTVHLSTDDQLPPSPTPSVMTCDSFNESLECVHQVSPSLWRFKCPRCGHRYKRYRSLCLHMLTHAPAFRYACGHCGHSFERWNKLWLHQRIHHRKGRCYTCSQCSLQFRFLSSYKMHLLNHAEERPFACPLCPQTFAHKEGLHVHQCSFHQTERKFECDVCARCFSNLTNLVKHSLLHNGAISHGCLLCSLSFANNKSLQEHLNAHNSASLLPSIPSEPLTFRHKCNRCKSGFSTGDLLYAHQICHTRDFKSQVHSTQSSESTSVSLGGIRSSTSRSLLSTLDLNAIPKESLFKYPHPDKLYVPPRLSRMSNSIPIINLDSDDDLQQEANTDLFVSPNSKTAPSGQNIPASSQEYSESDRAHQPQALESQESVKSKNAEEIPALHTDIVTNSPTLMFVETSVFLEGPTTTVNPAENETQDEIFECADCSEKLDSLLGLYEHYFLHALGHTNLYRFH